MNESTDTITGTGCLFLSPYLDNGILMQRVSGQGRILGVEKKSLMTYDEYFWDEGVDAENEDEIMPSWDDEIPIEDTCVECGDRGVSECDCCGSPLCGRHSECQANFCMSCLNDPNFDKIMIARYGEMLKERGDAVQEVAEVSEWAVSM